MGLGRQIPIVIGNCIKGGGWIPVLAATASTVSFGVLDSVQTHGLLEGLHPANIAASEVDFVKSSWVSVWQTTALVGGILGAAVGFSFLGRNHSSAAIATQVVNASQKLLQNPILLTRYQAAYKKSEEMFDQMIEEIMAANPDAEYINYCDDGMDDTVPTADQVDLNLLEANIERIRHDYEFDDLIYSLSQYGDEKLVELKQAAEEKTAAVGTLSTHVIGIGAWIAALCATQKEYTERRNPDPAPQEQAWLMPETPQSYTKNAYVMKP